jgi:hypothetical protein
MIYAFTLGHFSDCEVFIHMYPLQLHMSAVCSAFCVTLDSFKTSDLYMSLVVASAHV